MPKLNIPAASSLTIQQVKEFVDDYDNTCLYKGLWGTEYALKAMDIWERIRNSPDGFSQDEIIFAITYNFVVSPYTGRDDSKEMEFYKKTFSVLSGEA